MKIIQAAKFYFPRVGGMETAVINLSEGLIHYPNVSVQVIACQPSISFQSKRDNINGVDVIYKPLLGHIASLPISPTYISTLKKMKGDILHLHAPFPLTEFAFLLNPKIRKNFKKVVLWWQSDIVKQAIMLPLYILLLHRLLKKVDKIILNNPTMLTNSYIIPHYKEKCVVIPIGIKQDILIKNRTDQQAINTLRKRYGNKLVLFVGRIVYYKGIEYLIRAMKEVQDASLVIVGSGPLEEQVDEHIRKLKLEHRVFRISNVSNEELYAYYNACDLFVLPSIEKSEAYGIVQLEAMACGKPVICTELNTGTSFINKNGVTGYVVPPRDSKSLEIAIRTLLDNCKLREEMGKNGQERVQQEFTADKMVERVYNLYKNLLTEKD